MARGVSRRLDAGKFIIPDRQPVVVIQDGQGRHPACTEFDPGVLIEGLSQAFYRKSAYCAVLKYVVKYLGIFESFAVGPVKINPCVFTCQFRDQSEVIAV